MRHEPFKWYASKKAAVPQDPEAFFRRGVVDGRIESTFSGPPSWLEGELRFQCALRGSREQILELGVSKHAVTVRAWELRFQCAIFGDH